MEDLLKEYEFIPQKDNYNPWKGFILFYSVTIFLYPSLYAFNKFISNIQTSILFLLFFLIAPILLAFMLFFSNRKVIFLPFKIIVLAIELLMLAYLCSYFLSVIIDKGFAAAIKDKGDLIAGFIFLGVFLGEGLIVSLLLFPVIKILKKKKATIVVEKAEDI